jgi:DNA invertase Pin-like site-specific DNA recombinase
MGRRAAIYARISRDREGAGLGVDRQEADSRALARRLGWEVIEPVYCDNDLSAYTGKPRPAYRQLLADLQGGRADAVLAWHTDRLHRSPVELEEFIDVCEAAAVEVQTVRAGPLDLSTAIGRMVARQHGAVARYEVEHMSERQQRARQQAAEAGRFGGGRRPYGYQPDGMTLIPEEAAEVARACEQVLAGATLTGLAADLNRRGKPTSTGRSWTATELRRVLLRPRNAGLRQHQGTVIGPAAWPPLVDQVTWRAVVAVLTDPARTTNPGRPPRWLLSGVARCGVCGGPVFATSSGGRGKPAYVCRTGKHVVRDAAEVEAFVTAVILERLRRPDAADLLRPRQQGDDPAALHAEAAALRQRLRGLADAYAEDAIDRQQLASGSRRLRGRLAEVDRRLATAAAAAAPSPLAGLADAPDPAAVWARLPLDRRRAVIGVLADVVILPVTRKGRRPGWRAGESYFDPASVRVTPTEAGE